MTRWLALCGFLLGSSSICLAAENPQMVTFSITIATGSDAKLAVSQDTAALVKAVAELEAAQGLTHISRIKFSALEEQQVQFQFGEATSVVTGRSFGGRGGQPQQPGGFGGGGGPPAATSFSREQSGTLVMATARVVEAGVVAELNVEQTRFEKPRPAAEDPASAPPAKPTLSVKSSITIPRDGTVLFGGFERAADGVTERTVVLVSATVNGPVAAAKRAQSTLSVFALKFVDGQSLVGLLDELFPQRKFTAVSDARTNSLLVQGDEESIKTVEALIQLLDARPPAKPAN